MLVDIIFAGLTNTFELKGLAQIMGDLKNEKTRIELLSTIEQLKKQALSVKLTFPKDLGEIISEFIIDYSELLRVLYKYELINDLIKNSKKKYKDAQRIYGEYQYRIELLTIRDKIKRTYMIIEKRHINQKIEEKIKL